MIHSFLALNWLPAPTNINLLDKTNTSLEISWITPVIQENNHNAIINQHLAGTNYGYGAMGWAVFSTLLRNENGFVLKLRMKTPNALTVGWDPHWLPTPTSKFTIIAKTLHSPDNVEKEILNIGVGEMAKPRTLKWDETVLRKTAWGVFSTLTQGEYVVSEPRIVVETETAASIVFQPLRHLGEVHYQVTIVLLQKIS
ncbi:unnamed protein product [Angiostrongylus costaricensis]|uniref:Fibronectin type-III domain-containing protein n=1 Tax=Angiostrongylus costaricensis TaxID=334426 RepID=A0A0R3PGR3_ANGCS|nr:unnamed protein product [Angiostrongylus costaricensis]